MKKTIAFDLETELIKPDVFAPKLACFTWCDGKDSGIITDYEEIENFIRSRPNCIWIAHNCPFDATGLMVNIPSLNDWVWETYCSLNFHDTLIMEQLNCIADGTFNTKMPSLAGIVDKYLQKKLDKSGDTYRLRYGELIGVPLKKWPKAAVDYAVLDSEVTYEVYHRMKKPQDHERQARNYFGLYLESRMGVATDKERVKRLIDQAERDQEERLKDLLDAGFLRWQKRVQTAKIKKYLDDNKIFYEKTKTGKVAKKYSDKVKKEHPEIAYKDVLVKDTKLLRRLVTENSNDNPPMTEPSKRYPKGQVDISEDALARFGNHPGLEQFTLYKQTEKNVNTYLKNMKNGVIYGQFNPLVATGRTSSRSPNLQNIPRDSGARECIISRPGKVFVACDYDGAELRSLAQFCYSNFGFSALRESINAGKDQHLDLAAEILQIEYDEALKRKKSKDPVIVDTRQFAKCFHPETEVLTPTGWKRIDALTKEDTVAVVDNKHFEDITFEKPKKVFRKKNDYDHLIHFKNSGMDLRVTPDHNMLFYDYDKTPRKLIAKAHTSSDRFVRNSAIIWDSDAEHVEERLLMLVVAAQADGTFSGNKIRFHLCKNRKVKELLSCLREGDFEYTEKNNKDFYITLNENISNKIKEWLTENKSFSWKLLKLNLYCLEYILDCLVHWDGYQKSSTGAIYYTNTDVQSLDVLQAIASITNCSSRIRSHGKKRETHHKDCFRLTIKQNPFSCIRNVEKEKIPYTDEVVCLEVSSNVVLVRDAIAKIPVITYQCANFGFPGGLGATTFVDYARAQGVILTKEQAEQLKDQWMAKWIEIEEYFEYVKKRIGKGRPNKIVQFKSNRVRGGFIWEDEISGETKYKFSSAANSFFQGLTADYAKQANFYVAKACFKDKSSALYGSRPVLFIHDEIIIESPEDVAADAAKELETIMVKHANDWLPDIMNTASAHLMYRWQKKAEPKYNEEGKLIPWDTRC